MNTSGDIFWKISAYLDNELDSYEAEEVRKRLSCCKRFKDEYSSIEDLSNILSNWDNSDCLCVKASECYTEKLLNRIMQVKSTKLTVAAPEFIPHLILFH